MLFKCSLTFQARPWEGVDTREHSLCGWEGTGVQGALPGSLIVILPQEKIHPNPFMTSLPSRCLCN